MKYQIGQIIKSMDFPNRVDCYMVGIIDTINTLNETMSMKTLQIVSESVEVDIVDGVDTFQTYYSDDMFCGLRSSPRLQIIE